jgi:hypothetical protein
MANLVCAGRNRDTRCAKLSQNLAANTVLKSANVVGPTEKPDGQLHPVIGDPHVSAGKRLVALPPYRSNGLAVQGESRRLAPVSVVASTPLLPAMVMLSAR